MPTATIEINEIEYEIDYAVLPAEPDVGITEDYVEDWEITAVDGDKPTKEQEKEIYDNDELREKITSELNEQLDNLNDWWD